MISTGGRARSRDLSASPTMPMMSPQWVEMAGFARIWSTKRASSTAVMVWVPPTGTMAVSASDEIRVSRVVDLRRADGESETDQAAGLGMERLGHVVRPGGLCGDPPDSYPVPRFKGAKVTLKAAYRIGRRIFPEPVEVLGAEVVVMAVADQDEIGGRFARWFPGGYIMTKSASMRILETLEW